LLICFCNWLNIAVNDFLKERDLRKSFIMKLFALPHFLSLLMVMLTCTMGNAQNVGINDPAPTAKLTVKGTETTPDGQGAAIKLQNTAGTINAWYLRAGGSGNNTPKGGFSIADNSGYHFSISEGGNIGIGTTTPSEQLTLSSGNISLLSSNKGILLNGVDGPMINRGFDPFTSGNYTGLGRWGLFMEPNNLTLGIPTIGLKAFAVSSYNNNSTINKQLFRVSLDAAATNALVEVNGEMKIEGLNTLEFGAGLTKETNAGKIGYQTYTPGALDIVGAGTLVSNRKVNIFAEGGTTFNGPVKITGGVPAAGKVLTSDATGLASWQTLPSTNSGLEVTTSASQIIPASMFTKVIFDTEFTDDAAAFNTVTSELTIPSTGFYHLNSALAFSTFLPANTLVNLLIFRNGITIKYKSSRITGLSTIDLSADIKLTANDIITVYVIQTSGAPATINNGRDFTYLSGFKVY
jgi:hypothetical protein